MKNPTAVECMKWLEKWLAQYAEIVPPDNEAFVMQTAISKYLRAGYLLNADMEVIHGVCKLSVGGNHVALSASLGLIEGCTGSLAIWREVQNEELRDV